MTRGGPSRRRLRADRQRSGRRRLVGTAIAVACAFALLTGLLTGCGKGEFTYVADSDDKTYFKVPSAWAQVDATDIDNVFLGVNPDSEQAQVLRQRSWSTGYDASSTPAAGHMISGYPTEEPVVYSLVLRLMPAMQDAVSYDYLRDVFFPHLPVTKRAREQAAAAGLGLNGFELLRDAVVTPSDGVRGVRVIYNYELGGSMVHTFDMTAYTNHDSSILYLLLIRCTARCYRERSAELGDIATSFTVRSKA
jgi:hypothetical protein